MPTPCFSSTVLSSSGRSRRTKLSKGLGHSFVGIAKRPKSERCGASRDQSPEYAASRSQQLQYAMSWRADSKGGGSCSCEQENAMHWCPCPQELEEHQSLLSRRVDSPRVECLTYPLSVSPAQFPHGYRTLKYTHRYNSVVVLITQANSYQVMAGPPNILSADFNATDFYGSDERAAKTVSEAYKFRDDMK